MAELKDMAERLRGVGDDGSAMTCKDCRVLMRGKLVDALEAIQQLPEGVEWPRFEDGELVRFGDVFEDKDGIVANVTDVDFHSGKVVVWGLGATAEKTARTDGMTVKRPAAKPDTMDAIDADAAKDPCEYFNGRTPDKCADCKLHADDAGFDFDVQFAECRTAMARDLLARQRKLMGGE